MQKVVVITGVSSGIGYEAAKAFLAQGNFVVFGLSRKPFELSGMHHIVCDVSQEEQVKAAIEQIVAKHQGIDVLVNNAGMGISGAVEYTNLPDAKQLFDVNFFGTFLMSKHALPHMQASARIINIGSVAGELPIAFQSFYSASKAAVQSFSDCLRMEVKPFGVFVTTVLPGDTKTGFTSARTKASETGRYSERVNQSIARMERDEQKGMPASAVASLIVKQATKQRPSQKVVVGVQYKAFVLLAKFLPKRLVNCILAKLYA